MEHLKIPKKTSQQQDCHKSRKANLNFQRLVAKASEAVPCLGGDAERRGSLAAATRPRTQPSSQLSLQNSAKHQL
jgi:hypothetical protein